MFSKSLVTKLGCVLAVVGALLVPTTAQANTGSTEKTLIDWDKVAQQNQWANPTLNSSFNRTINVDGGGQVNFGFLLGTNIGFSTHGNSGLTPAINSVLNGSKPDTDKSLHIQIDPGVKSNLTVPTGTAFGQTYAGALNMATTFSGFGGALNGVSFVLHDIDISGTGSDISWQDRVILRGFLGNEVVNTIFTRPGSSGLPNNVSLINPNTLDGVRSVDNDNGGSGDILVSFGGAIDRFELIFTEGGRTTQTNPSSHGIGIGDISYTSVAKSVPEPTAVIGLFALGAFSVSSLRQRKQQVAEE
ncbi:hypothetical protein NIES4071_90570 [Calothrix sp. NIES-4071]|nr:hypothetical protein NIES4071_90570 [Calothrix sp. NIES-4071]BAZ63324.1 hypothetical protein NIES4105_90500 [Calothrix sp. NIES-4105]